MRATEIISDSSCSSPLLEMAFNKPTLMQQSRKEALDFARTYCRKTVKAMLWFSGEALIVPANPFSFLTAV